MISNEVLEELKDTIHPSVVIERALASNLLQTRADLAAAREELAKYRWIPVKESETDDIVLLHAQSGWIGVGYIHSMEKNDPITHWMPLPLPPKEGE